MFIWNSLFFMEQNYINLYGKMISQHDSQLLSVGGAKKVVHVIHLSMLSFY